MLIDNSTLSGVERLTGVSKTLNLSNTNNDILCFEKLVCAILFSDNIYGVNDYKLEYRRDRLKKFNYINFLEIKDIDYKNFASDASQFAREMIFSFEGSKPAGDVVRFFESLQIEPQMRWDIFVSSEYLTLSYLVQDKKFAFKEELITAALGNELTDRDCVQPASAVQPELVVGDNSVEDVKDLMNSFSDRNANFSGSGTGSVLEKMIFGYGWLAERSRFYASVASALETELSLSPLRDAFCESCLRIDYPNQISSLISNLKDNTQKTVASIVGPSGDAPFVLKMPFFTSFFIANSPSPSSALSLALEHRNRKELVECRDLLSNLKHLGQRERYKEVNKIMNYLESSLQKLKSKYGVTNSQGPSFSFSVGLTGPEISKDFKFGNLFPDSRNRPFAKIFRNMAVDMLNVERMGSLYEKMLSERRLHEKAVRPKISLTPSFMRNRSSDYSKPASYQEEDS